MPRGKKIRGQNTRPDRSLYCAFCGKDSKLVRTLIQGPSAFICNECVGVCQKVLRGERSPTFPSLDQISDEQLLGALRTSSQAVRDVVKKTVSALRARKVGWAAIGKALGISRQAAWQRFS